MAETSVKASKPIYASPAGLQRLFEKLPNANAPAIVDVRWVTALGIPFPDSIVAGLKFLGAVERSGKPRETFGKLRLEGQPFQDGLRELVSTAYKPVFDQFADLGDADIQDVNNVFRLSYGVGDPDRYVRPFLFLCDLAGMSRPRTEAGDVRSRAPGRSVPPGRARQTIHPSRKPGDDSGVSILLTVEIPWQATSEEVVARIKMVRDAAEEHSR